MRARPRWLVAGFDRDDLARLEAAAVQGGSPARTLGALARLYEGRAEEAEASGHLASAVAYARRAALAHLMRAVLAGARGDTARVRARAAYARAAAHMVPAAEERQIRLDGSAVAAYVRAGNGDSPVVVLLAEPGAGKEELGRLEDRCLARGAATVSLDLPSSGAPAWADAAWRQVGRQVRGLLRGDAPGLGVWATGPAGAPLAVAALRARPKAVAAVLSRVAGARTGSRLRPAEAALADRIALVSPVADAEATGAGGPGPAAAGASLRPSGTYACDEYGLDSVADWLCERLTAGRDG